MTIPSRLSWAFAGSLVAAAVTHPALAASRTIDARQLTSGVECDGDHGKKTSRAEAQCDGDGKKTSRAEAQCDGDGKKTSRSLG